MDLVNYFSIKGVHTQSDASKKHNFPLPVFDFQYLNVYNLVIESLFRGYRKGNEMLNPLHGLPPFDYIKPGSLKEASVYLSSNHPHAAPFSGGTDIFVKLRGLFSQYKFLVDIKHLPGMSEIQFDEVDGLLIGAAVDMNRVIHSPVINHFYPVLTNACANVASYQLRTRATIIGNICNASPAGDTIGACLLLDGMLNTYHHAGGRQIPLADFFSGPGETILIPGEIVTSIQIPAPPAGMTGTYIKLGRNAKGDLAIVGVTVVGYPDESIASGYQIKLALASVYPTPLVVNQVNDLLSTTPICEERIQECGEISMNASNPVDDVRASARYRKYMVRNLTIKAISKVWIALKNQSTVQ
jgi:carbon-monoxide dehydrogenase medium subunit